MNRKPCVVLLANLIAALPLLANAQNPRIMQGQAAGAKEPRIEIVRVKRTDSAAPEFQFRLSDGGTEKNAPAGFPESWRADRSQGCQSAVAALAQAEGRLPATITRVERFGETRRLPGITDAVETVEANPSHQVNHAKAGRTQGNNRRVSPRGATW